LNIFATNQSNEPACAPAELRRTKQRSTNNECFDSAQHKQRITIMDTNGNPFLRIETELRPYFQVMGQASDTILDAEVSSYPVFIAAKQEVPIGVLLMTDEVGWSVNASTLEELVARQIVANEHVANFRAVYKDPRQFHCVFVVAEEGNNFLFIPRTK
jgi:hypothetical protein